MSDELVTFLRSNGIRNDVDFYGMIRDYVFGSKSSSDAERQRNRHFVKHCLFFTSDNFFYKNADIIAFTAMSFAQTNYSQEEFVKKLVAGRKIIEIMWPGWFEFLNDKERKGEIVHAYDS